LDFHHGQDGFDGFGYDSARVSRVDAGLECGNEKHAGVDDGDGFR